MRGVAKFYYPLAELNQLVKDGKLEGRIGTNMIAPIDRHCRKALSREKCAPCPLIPVSINRRIRRGVHRLYGVGMRRSCGAALSDLKPCFG